MNTVGIKDVDPKFSSFIVFRNRKVLTITYEMAVADALLHNAINKKLERCTHIALRLIATPAAHGLQDTHITLCHRPQLVVFGCSAHYLNLVETVATPQQIMGPIVKINRFFREHHQPAGWLKEKSGMTPQLPNNTRWTSQRAALHTFVRNHSKYVEIRDEQDHDPVRFIQ